MQKTATKIGIPDRVTRTKIAAFASVDERTVKAFLAGTKRPYPATRAAIVNAMRTLGMQAPELQP